MVFFVTSRVLGLARDIVISHQFGTSRALDAYFAAFNVPDFIFNVIAGGALGSAFIPTFAAALAVSDYRRAWRLASAVINLALLLLTAIAVVIAVFAPQIADATVARGFAPADQLETANLMRWMLVTPIVFGVSGIVMGILNSHQHFVLPALAPVLYNASIVGGAVFLAPSMGVYGLAAGVVFGAFLHLAVQVPWLVRERMQYRPILGLQDPDVREVGRLMLPRTFGIAAVQLNFLINTVLASGLPAGRIAALSYAWRLMLLPVGIVGQSLGTAVFPTFSEQTARSEHEDFRRTFSTAFRTTMYLTVPAAVGLIILGRPLVALVFQRGEFDAQSTAETTWALQFYAIALFAHSGLEIVTRAFYAMHDTKTPVMVGVAAMAVNIALSLALIGPLAQGGLALATSVATILEMSTLLFILRSRFGALENGRVSLDEPRIAASIARTVAGALVMGAVLVLLVDYLAARSAVLVGLAGLAVGAGVYFGVTALLRSEEVTMVVHRLALSFRR
ncbi:MAG: murein biosynthesis integral membrane protein MurJ [Chloroflexi bacterium]|nr:murein biosynthesis integral membrane protein MurJ [Chloroflexota bacterium]